MRFRLGLVTGFAAGVYVGSWAGRERYRKLNRKVRAALKSGNALSSAGAKAKAVMELGVERAKDIVDTKLAQEKAITVPARPVPTGPPVGIPVADGAGNTTGGGAGG
jgi:hypothetical protein